ncbi:hypothetical protein RB195_012540 [Necator americanus]|uniref:Uncharacterized protein n=1 Tax=Necator americanus TaxID=51031 RepID=A0ABR1DRB9_NECAM
MSRKFPGIPSGDFSSEATIHEPMTSQTKCFRKCYVACFVFSDGVYFVWLVRFYPLPPRPSSSPLFRGHFRTPRAAAHCAFVSFFLRSLFPASTEKLHVTVVYVDIFRSKIRGILAPDSDYFLNMKQLTSCHRKP